jgi:hypothetical protein
MELSDANLFQGTTMQNLEPKLQKNAMLHVFNAFCKPPTVQSAKQTSTYSG